jgi:hypothetical protein
MGEEMREGSERSVTSTRPASGGLRPRLPGIHCPLSKLPNHAFVVQITKLCAFKLHAPNCMLENWMLPFRFDVVALFRQECVGKIGGEARCVAGEGEGEGEVSAFFSFFFSFSFFFPERIGKIGGETRCTAGEGKREGEMRWFC